MTYTRRRFIDHARAASAVVLIGVVGGCSEATEKVTGGLSVVEAQGETTTWGDAKIMVTVENTASESKSGTLYVELSLDNGETYSESRYIRLPGGSSDTYEFTVDISIFDSLSSTEGSIDAWVE